MRKIAFSLVFALLAAVPSSYVANAAIQRCPIYNFKNLFYADFGSGTHWDNTGGNLVITWSAGSQTIFDEAVVRDFSDQELEWTREAIASYDSVLSTVSFEEVDPADSPSIVLGFVELKSSPNQAGAVGYWNSWSIDGSRVRGSIKFKSNAAGWFSNKHRFIHSMQHELGNTLGLGDIEPTPKFSSVLEDPWQPQYKSSYLSRTDRALVRQLYGESTCSAGARSTK